MNRYRCVICWSLTPWSKGCVDAIELTVTMQLDQRVWTDGDAVSDGGVCDDCWVVLDGGGR